MEISGTMKANSAMISLDTGDMHTEEILLDSSMNHLEMEANDSKEGMFKRKSIQVSIIGDKNGEAAAVSRNMLGEHISTTEKNTAYNENQQFIRSAGLNHQLNVDLKQSFYNALFIGYRSFAYLARNQRSWMSPFMKDNVNFFHFFEIRNSQRINDDGCSMEILDRARSCMLDECQ
ncbi:hypothetical protein X798_07126 [Onchocerca flexuosa]|uniref:Uncharacterized protein n=1 Tax=Onchocerca flexuosa TaxID=387005 RepID=A0A238BLZ6_9BILA|nr:hypothetical protein X798_07126 [Onchocerca flexuosa]